MPARGEVVPYLIETGLLKPGSVVESDLVVLDASRRNRNYRIVRARGDCYFLKQGSSPDGEATVAHEAAMHQFLRSFGGAGTLVPFLPRYLRYDTSERVLVFELVREAETLSEHHARCGRVPSRVAATMGGALGTLHHATHVSRADLTWLEGRHAGPPWVLSIHLPSSDLLRESSGANVQLVRIVQEFPEFCAHLDRLRESWTRECVIHHDLKSSNCIVSGASASRGTPAIKIVDWELSGLGDPGWDVGSVFSDYLALWLHSAPITGETSPETFLKLTRFPLERMHPAIRAFWGAYVRNGEISPSAEPAFLIRSVLYAGARLVQATFESMQLSARLTGNAICLLQLGWNMMSRPHDASQRLLGLHVNRTRSG